MGMIDDVQKLKSILLNNHQLSLFNYISKPVITLNSDENRFCGENYLTRLERIFSLSKNCQNEEAISKITSYYQELVLNGNWSVVDTKLFDYLDRNFKMKLESSPMSIIKK